ncbi:MAG TPA: protein kinase, partial [Bacteroidota bacterium]|nr:protein kinase [Bacteroidota bacterium]
MIGQTISHYRILEKLGAGGMGVVYKAEDTKLKRTVALKFLPAHLSASEGNKDRFIHEAQAASALNHPNVCTIHDIQEHDGQLFIVMEFVDGVTLWDKIQESPMSVADALSWAIQIGEALQEAHSKGIVHRDMKSENIIINAKFRAKVMDFGLAQLKGSIHAAQTGTVQGTLLYMSPEQARGDDVVFATDIWSLGVVLYEMLTTKFPFYHEYETAILYSILNEPPIPPKEIRSDIPEELDRIIIKCLQKEWQRRYPSAMNLVSDLRKLARALESGTPVVPAKRRRTTESALDVERKPATVMLVSIGHYAEMAGLLEPEELADLLEKCLAAVKAVAEKYLGTMASVTGGRFTMIFGLPEAIEGAARNAVQAAVDVRTALQRIAEEKQQQRYLTPTVSIDTGLVIAGPFGAAEGKEYAVVGDPMELVVKLLEAAQPGGILVGPLTQKQTQDSFKYRKGKSVVFRGGRAPVPSYELVGTIRKTERGRMGTERMLASMYVGREPELNKLELHVLKAIQGEGSIVSILGEPGIGKTRLIAELRNREPLKRVTVMEGRAVSHGQNLSFHPIIDIVKRWIGAEEEDTEEEDTEEQLQRRLLDAVS